LCEVAQNAKRPVQTLAFLSSFSTIVTSETRVCATTRQYCMGREAVLDQYSVHVKAEAKTAAID